VGPGNVGGSRTLAALRSAFFCVFTLSAGRHDLNLSQGPLLPFLGASLVEDTVAELDAVLLENKVGKKRSQMAIGKG
jgi:hypothetical protein